VTYTPASNYYGPDSFTYTITDAGQHRNEHVSVTITNVATYLWPTHIVRWPRTAGHHQRAGTTATRGDVLT
jgi:hypothetical protein